MIIDPVVVFLVFIIAFVVFRLEVATTTISDEKPKHKLKRDEAYDTDWDYQRGCWKSAYWREEEYMNTHVESALYIAPPEARYGPPHYTNAQIDYLLRHVPQGLPPVPKDRPGYTRMIR